MIGSYAVLGVRRDASQEEIRRRYLALVRAHPPSREPERFQRITKAYEAIKSLRARVEGYLFGPVDYDTFDEAVADLESVADLRRRAPGLRELIEEEERGHARQGG